MAMPQFKGDEDEKYFMKILRLEKKTQSINEKMMKKVKILRQGVNGRIEKE
jgi:hypothetical protein